MKCIRMLTFIPVEKIEKMDKWDSSRINEKKEILAFDLTKLIHGEEEAKKARDVSLALFSGGGDDSHMPTTKISETDLKNGSIMLPELMVRCKLVASKAEARRLIQQGGVSVNGVLADSLERAVTKAELADGVKLRKGKKVFQKVIIDG